jgi:Uma2 family endonuclease
MASKLKPRFTPEEYLELEREAEFKSEYIDGEIIATTGASEPHNLIVTNIVRELSTQLKGRPCRVYSSDMRVDLRERSFYAYPDVVILCGEPKLHDDWMDNLLNPTIIIEVLSQSTEAYDRGRKFMKYRRIESLAEYVLVAQDSCYVEHYTRQPDDHWVLSEASSLDENIYLPSIECDLKLSEVYDKVDLSKERSEGTQAKRGRKRKL